MLIVLNHTKKWNVTITKPFKNWTNCTDLTFTAIKQYQVRKCTKAFLALMKLIFLKSSFKNLRHRCVIILTNKAFYLKASVRTFIWFAISENNHSSNIKTARKIRYIVRFNKFRNFFQAQEFSKFSKR